MPGADSGGAEPTHNGDPGERLRAVGAPPRPPAALPPLRLWRRALWLTPIRCFRLAGTPTTERSTSGNLADLQDSEPLATCAILLPRSYTVAEGSPLWGGVQLGRLLGAGVQVGGGGWWGEGLLHVQKAKPPAKLLAAPATQR